MGSVLTFDTLPRQALAVGWGKREGTVSRAGLFAHSDFDQNIPVNFNVEAEADYLVSVTRASLVDSRLRKTRPNAGSRRDAGIEACDVR